VPSGFCHPQTYLTPFPPRGATTHLLIAIEIVVELRVGTLVLLQQLLGHPQGHLALDEGMLQQALGGGSLLGVLRQRRLDEVVERGAPLVLVVQGGRLEAALRHQEEGAHRVQIEHRRLQFRVFLKRERHF